MKTALDNANARTSNAESRMKLQDRMLADKVQALQKTKEAASLAFHENFGKQLGEGLRGFSSQ